MKRQIITGLLALLPIIGFAQTNQWTLDDCVGYALENNITVQQIKLNVQSSKSSLDQSKMERYPDLNGSASYFYNHGRTVDPTTYTFQDGSFTSPSLSLRSSVTLFNGFRINNTIDQNEHLLKADEMDLENTKQIVAITITGYYLDALLAKEQVRIAENQLDNVEKQLGNIQKLVSAGSMPEGDLFNVEAQVAQSEFQLVNAQIQYDIALVNLQLAMLKVPSPDFQIVDPNDDISNDFFGEYSSAQAVITDAMNQHPSIKSAEYQMMGAQEGVEIAKSNAMPVVTLGGSLNTSSSSTRSLFDVQPAGYDTIGTVASSGNPVISNNLNYNLIEQNYPVMDQFKDNFNQSVSFQINIPIFNNFRAKNSVTQAEINRQRAELNLDQQKNNLRNNVFQSYTNAKAAQKRYEAAQKNVKASKKSFEYTQKKAEQGLVRPLDFQTAQNDLQVAEMSMVQAKYQYLMAIKILNYYLGRTPRN